MAKIKKFPYNLAPQDFIRRAQYAPFGECWQRVGDAFFGVKYSIEYINASTSQCTVEYFMTSGQVPASKLESVDKDFWERTLLNVCRQNDIK